MHRGLRVHIPTLAIAGAVLFWLDDVVAQTEIQTPEAVEAYRLNQRALALSREGRNAEAIPLARRALELSEKIYGPVHRNVSADLISLAALYRSQGDVFNAETMILRAIDIDKSLHGPKHPEVAVDMASLASIYERKGDHAAAVKMLREALKMLSASKDRREYLEQEGIMHWQLGLQLVRLNQPTEAMAELFMGEQILEVTDRRQAVEVLLNMAELARAGGDQARAETFLERARQLRAQ